MKPGILAKSLIGAGVMALVYGCDVEQTQEGKLPDVDVSVEEGNIPKYEVIQTEKGKMPDVDVDVKSGQLPKYDVDVPDVVVGTEEVEVEVPDVDVDMKKKTISVPVVGVETDNDND